MPVFRESMKAGEPYEERGWNGWMCDITGPDGVMVARVYNDDREVCRLMAIEMASAPAMTDCLSHVVAMIDNHEVIQRSVVGDVFVEASGVECYACEKLGQPSQMTYGPNGRAYHPDCVPEHVKEQVARMDAAASRDDERCPF